jgi:uncharacterized protein with PQ loop repeat
MELSASLVTILGFVAFCACFPQFLKLIQLKKSDQFSILTWSIWLIYELSSLYYSIVIGSFPYIFLNSLWVLFYAAMLYLIFRYKK